MRSAAFGTIAALAAMLFAQAASAAGGCPQGADSLEAYARCLAPVPGTKTMVYRGSASQFLDEDHVELLNAMERNPGVPPQVIPPGYAYAPWWGFNPYGPMMARAAVYAAAVKRGAPSYYYYFWFGIPYAY